MKLFSCAQIKENEMGRACGTYGGEGECVQNFCGKNWTNTLRRLKHRLDKNIKMDFKETGRNSVDWINIPQDGDSGRLCEHNDKYLGYTKCRELLD